MQKTSLKWKKLGKSVGFVPTMGALHEGHLNLIARARKQTEILVVSIYVNPSQFGPGEDFTKYPRPFQQDVSLCRKANVDLIFSPPNLYAPEHSTWVTEERLSTGRCSDTRPGHFRGVATVVAKLFNLVQPTRAYFGWKDAQQVAVIDRMVEDLNFPIEVIPVETTRDKDGLALSSRNRYLSDDERERALALPRLLRAAVGQKRPVAWLRRALGKCPGLRVDYVELSQGRLCAAIWAGKTRLIDNLPCP